MKIGKLLKAVGGVAATTAATAVNPLFGLAVGTAVGGSASKDAGKHLEEKTGLRLHKVGTPALVAGVPAVLAGTGAVDVTALCELATKVCENPALLGGALGAIIVFFHQLISGARRLRVEPG